MQLDSSKMAQVFAITCMNKKDGYRQRNVRQVLHIFASLGMALGQSR